MNHKIFIPFIMLALVTLACGLTFNIPIDEIDIGPTQTEDIRIPVPANLPADVNLIFGAGELDVRPGASGALIEGTATYNVQDFKPEIELSGSKVRLTTGDLEISGIPSLRRVDNLKNEWNLRLSNDPMNLRINSGAYKGNLELGGLSLNRLEISDGAADVRLGFSEANRVEMGEFRYQTGASSVRLSGLANANFSLLTFRSGAGEYTLDFSGDLQRDANVVIESGVSEVTIIVPEGTAAVVIFRGGLTNIDASGSWSQSGSTFQLVGSGAQLTISVEMGAGSLKLRTR